MLGETPLNRSATTVLLSPYDMVYSPNKYRETEGIKVRRIGYALDAATLQQVAYNHGIETNLNNLSQAQKAQLRYIAIMEQSNNAMNDMARTLDSPANQLRILESRIETLKRAIGDSLMPVVSAALPYITAFVQILGETFRSIAEFMGFELPVFDYSDTVSSGNEEIADSFNEATAASEKFKGSLAGIDQLNIIGSNTSSTPKGNQFGADLDLQLPEYDFLKGLKEDTNEAYNAMKNFFSAVIPWVEAFGAAMAVAFTVKKIGGFITSLSNVKSAMSNVFSSTTSLTKFKKAFTGIAGGLAAGASSGILFYNSVKNLTKETGTLGGNIASLVGGIGIFGTALGVFIKMKNPIGAILTAVGAVAGAVMGWVQAQKELDNELAKTITYADNGGIAVSALAKGFEGYFNSISSGYSDVIKNSEAMEENRKTISEAAGEIKNITGKFEALGGEITSDKAETIKSNIETIGKAVNENLGNTTRNLVERLTTSFSDLASKMGADIDGMADKFYLLESMGNSAIAAYKQQADTLVADILKGGLTDDEMSQKLSELDDVVMKMSGTTNTTAESVGFNRALENILNSDINLESETEVKNAISKITESAKTARETINSAWNSQVADLLNMKEQYISWGLDVKFDAQFGEGTFQTLFDKAKEILDTGYQAELDKIDVGEMAGLGMLRNQYEQNATKYAEEKYKRRGTSDVYWENLFKPQKTSEELKNQVYDKYKAEYYNLESMKPITDMLDEALKGYDISEAKNLGKSITDSIASGVVSADYEGLNNAFANLANDNIEKYKQELEKGAQSIDFSRFAIQSPKYTAEQVDEKLKGSFVSNVMGMGTQIVQNQGADYQTVSKVGQAFSENGTPLEVNINLQSYVELDGDQVGEAAARYSKRQMAYTNGY